MKRRELLKKVVASLGVAGLVLVINSCGGTNMDQQSSDQNSSFYDPYSGTLFYYDIDGYKKEWRKNLVVSPNIKKFKIYYTAKGEKIELVDNYHNYVPILVKEKEGIDGTAAEVYIKEKLKYGNSYTLKYPATRADFKVTPLELDKNIVTLKVGEEKTIKALKLHIKGEEYDSIKIESVKDSGFKYRDIKSGKNINGKVSAKVKNSNEIIIKGEKTGNILLEVTASSEDVNSTKVKANIFVKVQ